VRDFCTFFTSFFQLEKPVRSSVKENVLSNAGRKQALEKTETLHSDNITSDDGKPDNKGNKTHVNNETKGMSNPATTKPDRTTGQRTAKTYNLKPTDRRPNNTSANLKTDASKAQKGTTVERPKSSAYQRKVPSVHASAPFQTNPRLLGTKMQTTYQATTTKTIAKAKQTKANAKSGRDSTNTGRDSASAGSDISRASSSQSSDHSANASTVSKKEKSNMKSEKASSGDSDKLDNAIKADCPSERGHHDENVLEKGKEEQLDDGSETQDNREKEQPQFRLETDGYE